RDQNHAQLVRYDAQSGEREAVIYEEKNNKYVEPMNPIVFLPWNDGQFIMQSQKDGYNHLYLFSADGKLVRQLTKGKWVVEEFLGFNLKTKSAIIMSNELSPIQCNAFAVDLKSGKRTLLDSGTGVHSAALSASGQELVDIYSDYTTPRSRNLLSTSRKSVLNLHLSADPWKEFNVPEISGGTIKAADGTTDLYYRMVKPVDFNPAKKYPVVVYVYGGPHAHNVDASFRHHYRPWEIYMAQKGFVVFVLDNRGSENRGFEFESATFRHLGDVEMEDQMKGVEFLKSQPFVDGSRLGVHGWSFGGFMTTNLMLTHPDVFKVGVAGGPVIDWKYYEVMYGERYMDTPQSNPEGYKGSCINEKAGNLKGRLLVIYGGNDPTCVPQHTLSFIRSCIDKGTHPDLFTYPGDGHNMFGADQVHLHEHITRYFEDFLK
ncbi:MAG: prolyl oligopeptidase family serine peptidase, partial [Paludibacteraceae bacterium]|nr:prolyl oligopeptidase family serine peptidase [Paludibacteraceae bacterium]